MTSFGNLLMMRWLALNVAIGVVLILADRGGLIRAAWAGDTTWVTTMILALFAIGHAGVFGRIVQVSLMLDRVRGEGFGGFGRRAAPSGPMAMEALKVRLAARVRPFTMIGRMLVILGFFGTVWGMRMALEQIPAAVDGADAAKVVLGALTSGFAVAIWTTITGIAAYMALSFNVQLLAGGTERLYTQILERG